MTLNRFWSTLAAIALFGTLLGLGTACASPAGRVFVRVGPPAPIVDVRAVAPGPRHVWIPGFHRWDGRAYAWVSGRWELPPAGRTYWVHGRWVHDRRGWHVIEGHWR